MHTPPACRKRTLAPLHARHPPQAGKTPGIVFSGPGGEQHLLAFESKQLGKLVARLGRTAWACSLFDLQLRGEDGSSTAVRALVRACRACAPACPLCSGPPHCCWPSRQSACWLLR